MPRRRLTEEQVKERDRLIREYVKAGYSANRIQKTLSQKGLGMRRKDLLAEIRRVKGVRRKPYVERHIPVKYRRRVAPPWILEKYVAVYGSVHGISRRVEMKGTGRELYNAMRNVIIHPPRERFIRCHASEVKHYLDFQKEWDSRPDVES